MDPQWIDTDVQAVDKKDSVGRVYGWLRGENQQPPVVLDGKRPYAVVNHRPFMGRAVHHGTKVEKVAVPVPVLDAGASWAAVVQAFSGSLVPYLPVRGDDGKPAGIVHAVDALAGTEEGPDARGARVPVPGVRPTDPVAAAAKVFEGHPVEHLAVLDAAGAIVGTLPRATVVRLQDRSDHAPGRNDRRPDNETVFDEPVEGFMEGGWEVVAPDAPFARLRERLRSFPSLFVVDGEGRYDGMVTAPHLLRALEQERAASARVAA